MKTFISYEAKHSKLAGRIEKYLDEYSFNCFLAHEDIPPQSHWPQKILDNLNKCDLFIALLTPEYKTSFYCQQEVGYVVCRRIEILTILISEKPMGLISNMQGIKFNKDDFENSCWKIVKHVANICNISRPVRNKLIDEFGQKGASDYDKAGKYAEKILNQFAFTPGQAKKIMQYIDSTRQIYESKTARPHILEFIEKYGEYFKPKMMMDYKQRSRKWL